MTHLWGSNDLLGQYSWAEVLMLPGKHDVTDAAKTMGVSLKG